MKSLKFLLMFTLILGYGSVIANFYLLLVQLIELLLLILIILYKRKIQFLDNYCKYLLIIYISVFVSSIVTGTSILRYGSFIVRPLIGLLLLNAYEYDFDEIKNYYKKTLQIVTVLAVINFFLATVASPMFIPQTSESGYMVNTIGYIFNYIVATERFGITFVRNQGLFWEPGVLVVLMNIYIFILLFEEKNKLKKIVLPLFVLITTLSTSGYVVFVVILTIWFLKRMKNSNGSLRRRIAIFISGVIALGAFCPMLIEEVTYKTTTGVGSANKRMFDAIIGTKIVLDNPIFGIGFEQERYLDIQNRYNVFVGEDDNISYDERQNSNLFVMLFTYFGVPMALLFLYGLYKQNIFSHRKIYFFIILIALISEPVAFIDLYFMFIMSGSYNGFRNKVVIDNMPRYSLC